MFFLLQKWPQYDRINVSILTPLVDLLIIHLLITLTNEILEIYIPYIYGKGCLLAILKTFLENSLG